MANDKFFVFDDVLSIKEHEDLFAHMKNLSWTNRWSSANRRPDMSDVWHWNFTFFQAQQNMPAMTVEQLADLNSRHPSIISLWAKASDLFAEHLGKFDILRLYANCNPYGTNAYIHVDDGDYTAIYYPCTDWDPEWEGGTCFYEKDENENHDAIRYVSYKPNRLVIFPAHIPHRGMPVDRRCWQPRYVVAMKLQRDVNDSDYAKEFYNAK
jgi:2OG-Fe(II) oxygenase superfamily